MADATELHRFFAARLLFGMLIGLVATVFADSTDNVVGPGNVPVTGYVDFVIQGNRALASGHPDSARDFFLAASDKGMPDDSLYFLLAKTSLAVSAYDTAMAFNLSIRVKPSGSFRDSVLYQRYHLYLISGLRDDANKLHDSLQQADPAKKISRKPYLEWKAFGGYNRDEHFDAFDYPFQVDLGGFSSTGWQFKNQAIMLWPLAGAGSIPLSGGLGYEIGKSYFNDSLDYRGEVRLKADHVFDSLTLIASGQFGRVTEVGEVFSYKLESSYLTLNREGFTFVNGGYESEFSGAGRNRYDALWISIYHDRSVKKGRGFAMMLSASGVRIDPLEDAQALPVTFVDDVSRAKPTHFTDGNFQDTIAYNRFNAYTKLTQTHGEISLSTISPQAYAAIMPGISYNLPVAWNWVAEAGTSYSFTVYPDKYVWDVSPAPAPAGSAQQTFQTIALNRANGLYYSGLLRVENGGLGEYYGGEPLQRKERRRMDQRVQGNVALRRPLSHWGYLGLEAAANRTWSTLSASAPVWIPRLEWVASLKWTGAWGN